MPSNWSAVDMNFPAFKGNESPHEQIRSLLNYMFVLTEQLRYSLANLNASNWNASALQNLQSGTTKPVEEQIAQLRQALNAVVGGVSSLSGRVTSLSGTVTGQEQEIVNLQIDCADLLERTAALEEAVSYLEDWCKDLQTGQENLETALDDLAEEQDALSQRLDNLEAGIRVTTQEDGATRVDITGDFYINGLLFDKNETGGTA